MFLSSVHLSSVLVICRLQRNNLPDSSWQVPTGTDILARHSLAAFRLTIPLPSSMVDRLPGEAH